MRRLARMAFLATITLTLVLGLCFFPAGDGLTVGGEGVAYDAGSTEATAGAEAQALPALRPWPSLLLQKRKHLRLP